MTAEERRTEWLRVLDWAVLPEEERAANPLSGGRAMPYEGLPGGPVLETCGTLAQRHPRFNGEGLGMSNIPVAGSHEDISQFALCGYRDAAGVPVGRISGTDAIMEFFGIPPHRRSLALRLQHEIPNPSVIKALRRLDLPTGKTMLRVIDED